MTLRRGTHLLAILTIVAVLPSCFLLRVPVETAGTVVTASAHVAEKTATTTVGVAGKAAEAVIDGRIPATNKSVWTAFR